MRKGNQKLKKDPRRKEKDNYFVNLHPVEFEIVIALSMAELHDMAYALCSS